MSNRAIAWRMGVTEATNRKLVGPEQRPLLEVLPLFLQLLSDGFDVQTYRKGRCPPIEERCFVRRSAVLDGRKAQYRRNDGEVNLLQGDLRLRQVTRLSNDGHQAEVFTSRWDLLDVEAAYRMFDRWRHENFFKQMREEFLLDALVDYHVEPDNPTHKVPNPARKTLDTIIRAARSELAKLEQDYGAAAINNLESKRHTMRGFKISHGTIGKQLRAARDSLHQLLADRSDTPPRVEVRDQAQARSASSPPSASISLIS